MLVRHFMTRPVITLDPKTTCADAAREMRKRRIRRAPIATRKKVLGLITLHDLVRVLPGTIAEVDSEQAQKNCLRPVSELMSRTLHTVQMNDHLEQAAQLMLDHKIGGLPVLNKTELVGILTESDVFRAMWGILSSGHGKRIILEEPDSNDDTLDYLKLALRHGCRPYSLLRCQRPGENTMTFLRVQGTDEDGLVEELWDSEAKVISID